MSATAFPLSIRSKKQSIAHAGITTWESFCIHFGSMNKGHQQPPIAAIVRIVSVPNDLACSREWERDEIRRPMHEAEKATPKMVRNIPGMEFPREMLKAK